MKLSSDDLPMFFEPRHAELADRLRAASAAICRTIETAAGCRRQRSAIAHAAADVLAQ